MQVLVADSDTIGVDSLSAALHRHGFDTEQCGTGAEALAKYPKFDFFLIDLALPDMDGLEVCRLLRAVSDIPIIAFTDPGTDLDRILCLQAGCDDCMAKPFGFRELLARIEAVLRRSNSATATLLRSQPIVIGSLCIDPDTREVRINGRLIELTRIEYCLLHQLASQPQTVFSRDRLMADVWGYQHDGRPLGIKASRTIDTHVSALRKKLGDPSWIVTLRGIGFRMGHG
ncbi:DNA-binding response regulator, OmpR family, contains REC and winged-helix (wHTH) domain [Streptomyces sp. DvalAA-14]|uniref:response regulator transcription factor n=1 Tax=unclassified Streptomyces TaxID=2593676 RepID=UPI00081B9B7B|nr:MULTISPECIES: response regulator transcription factor [unclassified Streptomyces]MYS19310.1 response regulator [Streptomyces sp. SID4948]SCD41650.1 DNA-binding response regulator, OmpR family, contains REC and winged-helix (wHTH) domain [Streptomyces sp. DvalAA-14]